MKRAHLHLILLLSTLLLFSSCRSSKTTLQEYSGEHIESRDTIITTDSGNAEIATTVEISDTTLTLGEESGEIRIIRDTVGNPERIIWRKKTSGSSIHSGLEKKALTASGETAGKQISNSCESRQREAKAVEKRVEGSSGGTGGVVLVFLFLFTIIALFIFPKGGMK